MALCTVTEVQLIPGLGNVNATFLQILIDSASQVIEDYTKQKVLAADYTEYYSGDNTRFIVLQHKPVNSITNLWYDPNGNYGQTSGAFASGTLLTQGSDYDLVLDEGGTVSHRGTVLKISGAGAGFIGYYPENFYAGKLSAYRLATWPRGDGNLKVQYNAGYTVVPPAIKNACMTLVAWMNRNMPTGAPLSSENLGSYSYSVGTGLIGQAPELGTIRQMLAKYRDQAW